jgi:hypothetical protein
MKIIKRFEKKKKENQNGTVTIAIGYLAISMFDH